MKIKHDRKPLIILMVFAAVFIIAAVSSFLVPRMSKSDAPIELVNNKIEMIDGGGGYYFLDGKLKNVSDQTVTIKNIGGMEVYFSGTSITFDDCWQLDPSLPDGVDLEDRSNYIDIVLIPGETYDFNDGTNCLNGKASVTRVIVTFDGVNYNLLRNTGASTVLTVVFIIFALICIVLAVTQDKAQRDIAAKRNAALELCAGSGEQCYLISGTVHDKSESKKAAAKTAGWAFGAVLSTLLTGRGVYRVYSGTSQIDFILSEHALYSINAQQGTPTLTTITRADFPASAIETKKNKVIVKNVDGKKSLILLHAKKDPLTVGQIAGYLDNIFLKPVAEPVTEADGNADKQESDPFGDLAPEKQCDADATRNDEGDKTDGE